MNKVSKLALFLLLIVAVCMVAACGKKKNDVSSGKPAGETVNEQQGQDTEEQPDETQKDSDENPEPVQPDNTDPEKEGTEGEQTEETESQTTARQIGIYTIDDNTLETVSLTAMVNVSGELTVEAVIDAVILALEDHSLEVQIAGIQMSDESVTVDILADEPLQPFGNAGSSVEETILDCISYSVFDNFESLKTIYFTVNGEAYESGHIYLPEGEPYLRKE